MKGERCSSAKCSFIRRSYAPGFKGASGYSRLTEYGVQLREKQKAKAIYGILEKQFRGYYDLIGKGKKENTMLGLIERRLDNVVFRLGFASSRRAARQAISHSRFLVNGKKNNIPSYQVKVGDVITFKNKDEKDISKEIKNNLKRNNPVSWLKTNPDSLVGEVTSMPKSEDIGEEVNERLIIEFYSR